MAPTIQNGNSSTGAEVRPQRPIEKRSDLMARVKYGNTLPDIPFDLKYITYPFAPDRFVQYNPTSLERNYKYEVLTEHDLGVTIDLINRDLYHCDPNTHLDPADERLLEEEVHTPQDSQRSRHHAKSVSWLRKSEYISTEQTRFQPQNNEKVEAKVGFNVRKSFVEETLYMDREAQIKSIEKTFEENKKPITRHYSKPHVTAVEICPVYPDFANWKYPFAQVIFDSDPAPTNTTKHVTAQMEEMSQAMIRGVMDESGEQFVAYFLPTEETMEKRRLDLVNEILYEDDQEYEYKMAREYNWNVKSKASKNYEENYFLIMRQDGVYYNELETRVRLNKRRQNTGQQPTNTKLVVKHVPLTENDDRMQRIREKQLEPPCEDDEIEEIEEVAEEPAESEMTAESQENVEVEKESADKMEKTDGNESEHSEKSRSSRSRSRSVHSRRSRSGSARSRSGSRSSGSATNRSRSGSATNRSRSGSATSNHSGSGRSRSGSRSRSNSRSRSGSAASNRSGSVKSGSRSRSGSPASNRSGSHKSRSRSRSRSRSSRSRSRSYSGSENSYNSGSNSSHSQSPHREGRSSETPGNRSGSASPNDSD